MAGFTQEQYDAICEAIAQGTLTVSYAGESVTYRSLDELLKIKDLIAAELGLIGTTTRVFPKFNKGLFPKKNH